MLAFWGYIIYITATYYEIDMFWTNRAKPLEMFGEMAVTFLRHRNIYGASIFLLIYFSVSVYKKRLY